MDHWTPADAVTVLAALSAFAVSVINALKATQTRTQGEANRERLGSVVQHLHNHDQQLTTLALNMPAPGVAGTVRAAQAGGPAPASSPSLKDQAAANTLPPRDLDAILSDTTVLSDSDAAAGAGNADLIAPQGPDLERPQ